MPLNLEGQTAAAVITPPVGQATVFLDSTTKALKSKNDAGVVTDYTNAAAAITALTGDVTGTGPGSTATSIADAIVSGKLLTGLISASGTPVATDTILQAFGKLLSKLNSASLFGNGSDGVVTLTVDTILVRDMYYDTLTINPGINLFTAGFRVFVLNTLTVGAGSAIDRSGASAVGAAATAGLLAGTLGVSGAGGAGGGAAGGTAGTATTTSPGGTGGAGGTGAAGAGGAAGTATVPTAALGGVEQLNAARQAAYGRDLSSVIMAGGAGGGGGGGGGAATSGGAGGAGGGIMVLCVRTLTGTGTVKANGGNGASAPGVNGGGGGGGGGGTLCLVTENDTTATALTFSVSGGLGQGGNGTGLTGANGSVGRIFRVRS